jgi:hypothetical protein
MPKAKRLQFTGCRWAAYLRGRHLIHCHGRNARSVSASLAWVINLLCWWNWEDWVHMMMSQHDDWGGRWRGWLRYQRMVPKIKFCMICWWSYEKMQDISPDKLEDRITTHPHVISSSILLSPFPWVSFPCVVTAWALGVVRAAGRRRPGCRAAGTRSGLGRQAGNRRREPAITTANWWC